jgi:hypothetical protein
MRPTACQGNIRYWALGISVLFHAAALAVFTGVQLSNHLGRDTAERPSISMQMIETVLEQPVPIPIPQVEAVVKPEPRREPDIESEPKPLVVEAVEIEPAADPAAIAEPVPTAPPLPPAPFATPNEVEFFGQKSIVQRICYVVDCSGSMYGQMYRVKDQLKQSIMKLNPSQAFCVLFFMDGREVLMTGSGKLEAATVRAKSQALELIGKVKPGGRTDAAHALECAMQLRDTERQGPEVIYFLTDGFNLDESGSQLFVDKINRLRRSLAPSAVVHTIGFWPEEADRRMLKTLAQQAGGVYIEVEN